MSLSNPAANTYLDLIEASGIWGAFNGPRIAADLRASQPLWQRIIFTRQPRVPGGSSDTELRHRVDLILHQAQPGNGGGLDRLYIVPNANRQDEIERLAQAWQATEIAWLSKHEASRSQATTPEKCLGFAADEARFVLSLWWE
jgi:hypothetical protein